VIYFKESDPETGEIKNITGTRTAGLASSGAQGAVPRWRHYVSGNWQYGPWNATLAQSYQHGYTEYPETAAAETIFGESRHVGSYSIWDLQGQYQGIKNLTLTAGIKNLFDRDPPLSIVNQGFVLGWDKLYADPTGRFFYGSIRYTFK
jgi:iron complex outermembrane receptor protein